MKSKQKKSEELKSLAEKLSKARIKVVTSFAQMGQKGLSVAQMAELKRLLKAADGEYVITKKTLMDIAFRKLGQKETDVYGVDGSVGLALGSSDEYEFAKKIYEFAKKNPALKFFGALVEGQVISGEAFLEMAKLPSREQLIGRLLGMIKYPIAGLCVVLNEIKKSKIN